MMNVDKNGAARVETKTIMPRAWRTIEGQAPVQVRRLDPVSELAKRVLIGVIWLYRWTLSPWLGNQCRHVPTCSEYAIRVLHERGPWVGTVKAVGRLMTCHPFCKPSGRG